MVTFWHSTFLSPFFSLRAPSTCSSLSGSGSWRGCSSPVCSVLYRANPLRPARRFKGNPAHHLRLCFLPSFHMHLPFCLPVLYAGLCSWRTAHPLEWIKPRVGSRLWHLEGLTFSYTLFCVVRNWALSLGGGGEVTVETSVRSKLCYCINAL